MAEFGALLRAAALCAFFFCWVCDFPGPPWAGASGGSNSAGVALRLRLVAARGSCVSEVGSRLFGCLGSEMHAPHCLGLGKNFRSKWFIGLLLLLPGPFLLRAFHPEDALNPNAMNLIAYLQVHPISLSPLRAPQD